MPHVVFAAPFFLRTTLRFVDAVASLPGVKVSLVSVDPAAKLPAGLRSKLAAHRRVEDGLDPEAIGEAVRSLGKEIGPVHRLLGALEDLQIPLAMVREELKIEGMGVEAASNFRDKSRMKTVLREAGLPCAGHGLAESVGEVAAVVRRLGYPLVVKPPSGAGARNTFRVNDDEAMRQCIETMPPSPGSPMLLEEFITGEEHSFDAVLVKGRPVWHSLTHYIPGPLQVMENPWIQWCVLLPREVDHPRYDDIREIGALSLKALGGGTGLYHMEWFRRADGSVAISEVGARPPGAQFTTLISYAHDYDMYRGWARLMVFDEFDPPKREYAAGIAFLRGQGRGRVVAIRGLDQAQKELGGIVVEVKLPAAGQSPSTSYEGDGYVVVRHSDTALVERALARIVSLIRVDLGQGPP